MTGMAEMEVIPQEEMAYAQGIQMFTVERHALPEDFVGVSCSAWSAIVATVATHNVRTMAGDRTHGVWRALDGLSVYDRLRCDVIGLQETHRSGHSTFSRAGYLVYCSGECGGKNYGKKEQGGVGLAVRTSIARAARPPQFISDHLSKVTLELRGQATAVTFFVAYAPTEIQNASYEHAFWTSSDRAVKEVPRHEQLFELMDANARTDRREKGQVGSRDSKISRCRQRRAITVLR